VVDVDVVFAIYCSFFETRDLLNIVSRKGRMEYKGIVHTDDMCMVNSTYHDDHDEGSPQV
jgi:hypothetical protein